METRKVKSHLSHGIEKTEEKARYDEGAKELLSDKQILARIAKYRIKEFEEYDIPTIMECIEGKPEISVVPVYPGKKKPEVIIGMYSIWIFFEAPEKDSDTITEYSLTKKEMLEQKHQMHMTRELEGGITSMCNLSEGLWERAIEEGREEGIHAFIKLARKYHASDEETIKQLMEEFQLEETKAKEYLEKFGNGTEFSNSP